MKIYISGKITGLDPLLAATAFEQAAYLLKTLGYEPINPMENEEPGLTRAEYMAKDMVLIDQCDGMYMLSNWEDSKRARIEKHIAETLEKPIFYAVTGIPKLNATFCKRCKGSTENPASFFGYCSFECLQLSKHDREPRDQAVDHPAHYNAHPSGIECIEVVRHMSFNIGNAMKYLWRADEKGAPVEDLKKAVWYLNDEIDQRESNAR